MTRYRLVAENTWEDAIKALEAATNALKVAGTVTMPDEPASNTTKRRINVFDQSKDRLNGRAPRMEKAQEVIDRVRTGGPKHKPKAFDREGPSIADFVYLLTSGRFTPPDAISPVSKYVELKPARRDAGSQIRTAIMNDELRFERQRDGTYLKLE